VSCQFYENFNRLAFVFRVVSSSHSVQQVRVALLEFISVTAQQVMTSMTDDKFRSYASAVVTQLRTDSLDMNESADPFWSEIAENRYCFQRTNEQIRIIPTLHREDVLSFFVGHFVEDMRAVVIECSQPAAGNSSA
jgi:secreted Zn-dependent insulinase-like peptidase